MGFRSPAGDVEHQCPDVCGVFGDYGPGGGADTSVIKSFVKGRVGEPEFQRPVISPGFYYQAYEHGITEEINLG